MQLSVATVLQESAARHPDRVAVVEGDVRITYRTLWHEALGFAARLRAHGIGPGDRVALLLPNTVDFPRAYYGVLAAGGTVVPVHALLVADEVVHVLKHSGCRAIVTAEPYGTVARAAADAAGVEVLHVDAGDTATARPEPRDADDTAVILYTSGTTGKPKGALLTHANLVLNASVCAQDLFGLTPDDVVLGCLPLFHSFGQSCAMNAALRAGATLVLCPRFTGPGALELMAREGVTVFMGVPTMYHALVEAAADDERRPALRMAVSGGAALPVALFERFEATFSTMVLEGYGLTETSPAATFNQPAFGRRPGTVGHPIWGVEAGIADADTDDRTVLLPDGEVGEVVLRGHNIFAGYLDDPAASAAAVVDGWFRTGDLGVRDADGRLSIVDRKKDLIIRGGFNVYPREVEEVLARHPAIAQVSVIGLPDEERGEEVCAAVVLRPDATDSGEEIVAWARERLGRHKYPRVVRLLDALPLGPSGKILKRELQKECG
ncbi:MULTISPECIES: long-chain fatty acid--CoA ligase [unclassified Streptomyces]|uniref:long-chain-fatty-acid--CoA ligase n=1 Tax=unclassified Streptomyces TaxID=2593676 RepID=UPI000DB9FF8E|nr:long-chain fatty acid--CoA ligase [Streptomyces sp. PsTaAH-137]MYT75325.1 AMP-binding protein [Streptomyces sp. SID8367]RAJ86727.1 long-chain acyl-CoA synthetase [Streptomyces sp. PsTaAH-137]